MLLNNIPEEVYTNYILKYIVKSPMKLLDWVDIDKLDRSKLSRNLAAIDILKENQDKIYWYYLSENPAAIDILIENQDKINWVCLSANEASIELLKDNQDKLNWNWLSDNRRIFEIDNIKWRQLIQSYYDSFIKID